MTPRSAWAFFLVAAGALSSASAAADVVEYYNLGTGHYFLTAVAEEGAAIDSGAAGPGWIRTGLAFQACATEPCGKPVNRFYAPGPRTHFFTINGAEAAMLKQPGTGWIYEGDAFTATAPTDAGCGANTPVYRLYNNNPTDSTHRFVTRADERDRMLALGWVYEGVGFCAYRPAEVAIKSFAFVPQLQDNILPSAECEDETRHLGSCVAVNNLPVPASRITYVGSLLIGLALNVTGTFGFEVFAPPQPNPTSVNLNNVIADVFLQNQGSTLGIHVDSRSRGQSVYSSVNPLYQFKTTLSAGAADARVFPFNHAYETDAQIAVRFDLKIKRVAVRSADSHAYGHPTIEFIDQRSGRHLYMTALTYGTTAFGDYLAPDVATGKVIVGTTLRWDSPFLSNVGLPGFRTVSDFVSQQPSGDGGHFEYRIDRAAFLRVLQAARSVDTALSPDPVDYLLDNFHFNNEVVREAEIGLNLANFALEILRR